MSVVCLCARRGCHWCPSISKLHIHVMRRMQYLFLLLSLHNHTRTILFRAQVGLVLHRDDESHSPETQSLIDQEVKRLCQTAYENARTILTKYRDQLERIAAALLEYETLSADEIKVVMKGGKLNKEIGPPPTPKYVSRFGLVFFRHVARSFL